jgi:transposase
MITMEAIIERCCGIDVHKKTIVACLMVGKAHEKPRKTIKTFSTMTRDLLACKDWLDSEHCTTVAMESSGVYWKPVFNILEDSIEVILANARHIKNVPGRKTDVKDCEWIAQLLRHGLIKGSFIPPRPIRELRDLTRYRRKLIQAKASELNRIHKVLEDANIKLSSVVSDLQGLSAQDMIEHLMREDMSPKDMAALARGRLRKKITELEKALEGSLREHHRLILRVSIQMIASYDTAIAQLDNEIDQRIEPYREQSERLQSIPGVKKTTAESLLAEIGVDMSRFPSHAHLSSWAGLSPGNNESAGKRKSGRSTPGNRWLKGTLTEAAWAASRSKGTYLTARYHRLASRRGRKRACLAVGHTILIMAYHIIKEHCTYRELGADYFDRLNELRIVRRLTSRIQALGYHVSVEKLPMAA